MTTWCPRAIKEKENRSFSLRDITKSDGLSEAVNTEGYRGSLKHNFFEKESIQPDTSDDRLLLRRYSFLLNDSLARNHSSKE